MVVEPERRFLTERYQLVGLIASGGMGQVWQGTDLLLGRPVAVKVLRSEYTSDPTFLARFRAEAQHSGGLSHPNIAAVFDYGETTSAHGEALAFLVMELVSGEPLSALLHREHVLDADTTMSVLEQTAAALAEAHRVGLVHRDVKPGNILVCPDGTVKITDFGIAWSAGSVPLTRTGQVIGTPQYLSPEQAEGSTATPASDVYALGLVGYECLAGQPAFDGDNAVSIALKQLREEPAPLPADVPPALRALLGRALAKRPAARMADGAAFAVAMAEVRSGRMPEAAPADGGAGAIWADPHPASAVSAADEPPAAGEPRTAEFDLARPPLPPPSRLRRRSAAVLTPVIALLVGAAAAAALFLALIDGSGDAPVAAAQTQERQTVTLVEADYLGRPVDDVAAQLSALGLTVRRQPQSTDAVDPNSVLRVDPVDRALVPGDVVDVWFAVADEDDAPTSPGRATGSGPVGEVATTDPPAPETTSPPTGPEVPSPSTTATSTSSEATTSGSGTATSTPATSSAPSSSSASTSAPAITTAPPSTGSATSPPPAP